MTKTKTYLITGYGSVMGKELAKQLRSLQNRLLFVGRSDPEVRLDDVWIDADLSEPGDIYKVIEIINSRIDELDGIAYFAGRSEELKRGNWNDRDIFLSSINSILSDLMVNAVAFCALVSGCAELLSKSKNASTVLVSSIGGHLGFPNNPGYVLSKHAALGVVKSLAVDYGSSGIRVNSVSPGYIRDTSMTQKSWINDSKRIERQSRTVTDRWGYPSEIASAVKFLLSSESSYITGTDLCVDGGFLCKGL